MNDLVKRLSEGSHAVEASLRREDPEVLQGSDRSRIRAREVHGNPWRHRARLQARQDRSDLSQGNFEAGTGNVHVSGELTLDYVPVRVHADIDLASLQGRGHLGDSRRTEDVTHASHGRSPYGIRRR